LEKIMAKTYTEEFMATLVAACTSVSGSMGSTVDVCVLHSGGESFVLPTSYQSNYEYSTEVEAEPSEVAQILQAAPAGALLSNSVRKNWAGQQFEEYVDEYVKLSDGNWQLKD
jgi:hypothetical protein